MQDMVQSGLHNKIFKGIPLTTREVEVLERIIKGRPNKLIANEFNISESTIKTHRKNIMSKLNADNSITLLYNAFEANFISESEIPLCKNASTGIHLSIQKLISLPKKLIRYPNRSFQFNFCPIDKIYHTLLF